MCIHVDETTEGSKLIEWHEVGNNDGRQRADAPSSEALDDCGIGQLDALRAKGNK
jgi:hypothetical protein